MKRLAVFFVSILCAATASACPVLEHADPRVGSTVQSSPDHVTLAFSMKIIPASSTLDVTDAQGVKVSTGAPYGKEGDDTVIATHTRPLAPGKYNVTWNVLCDCGSLTPGHYTFTVGNGEPRH